MSMISDLVDRLRVEAKSMGTYGTDYMATLLTRAAYTIEMLSEKARESKEVVMPKKCKGCDSASKIIEAYSRGWTDGAEAVKAMPNSSEKPNNSKEMDYLRLVDERKMDEKIAKRFTEDLQDWKDRMWAEAIVTEPQPATDCRQTDCYMCKWLGEVDVCGRCRNRNLFAEADTEPKPKDEPTTKTETQNSNLTFEKRCKGCRHYKLTCDLFSEVCKYEPTTEDCSMVPTSSKMEQVEDEPMKTTDYCDICKRDMCEGCIADATNPYCVPSHYEINYEPKDEPQTDWHYDEQDATWYPYKHEDEPQTEPNLILPERMERGEMYEVGDSIVVMNSEYYYDLLCKSWEKTETQTRTQTETKNSNENSNLTFEKRTMRDCYNCKRYETEGECIECKFEPKTEDEILHEQVRAFMGIVEQTERGE